MGILYECIQIKYIRQQFSSVDQEEHQDVAEYFQKLYDKDKSNRTINKKKTSPSYYFFIINSLSLLSLTYLLHLEKWLSLEHWS